jgi:hypothetical protein
MADPSTEPYKAAETYKFVAGLGDDHRWVVDHTNNTVSLIG